MASATLSGHKRPSEGGAPGANEEQDKMVIRPLGAGQEVGH